MHLTNSVSECDKQNHNFQNYHPPTQPLKKKIEKKSLFARYKSGKTIQSIRRLTLDLKKKIEGAPKDLQYVCGELTLKSNNKCQKFICFSDEMAVEENIQFSKLLKRRLADNDQDSQQQNVEMCVQFMKDSLIQAGNNKQSNKTR